MKDVELLQGTEMEMLRVDSDVFVFPGGEPHAVIHKPIVVGDAIIRVRANSAESFLKMMVLNDAVRRQHPDVPRVLYIPYLPGARQDRGAPLTCKVYADMINMCEFDRVHTLDPHSDVMPALLTAPLRVVKPHQVFDPTWVGHKFLPPRQRSVVIAPDAGAEKRVSEFASVHGYDVVRAGKKRDFRTGQLSGFWCDHVPDHVSSVIVVDDICDGGGTFLGLADQLPDDVSKHLVVSHGIFSKGVEPLLEKYDTVLTTDSFQSVHHFPHGGDSPFKIIPVMPRSTI